MKTTPKSLALVMALALLAPTLGIAQAQKSTPQNPATPVKKDEVKPEQSKRDTYPLYGVVISITDKLLVIKGGQGKPDRKYDMTPTTRIHADEKSATLKDVKQGRWVGGLLKKSAKGNDTVVSLNVDVVQKDETTKPAQRAVDPTPVPKKKTN